MCQLFLFCCNVMLMFSLPSASGQKGGKVCKSTKNGLKCNAAVVEKEMFLLELSTS